MLAIAQLIRQSVSLKSSLHCIYSIDVAKSCYCHIKLSWQFAIPELNVLYQIEDIYGGLFLHLDQKCSDRPQNPAGLRIQASRLECYAAILDS